MKSSIFKIASILIKNKDLSQFKNLNLFHNILLVRIPDQLRSYIFINYHKKIISPLFL